MILHLYFVKLSKLLLTDNTVKVVNYIAKYKKRIKQAGPELGQVQFKLGLAT